VPEIYELHLRVADPVTTAWRGGASLAASAEFVAKAVTRETYHREGSRAHQQGHRSAWDPRSR
jgi:actin-related protein